MKRVIWILAVLLLLSQAALQFPAVRSWLIATDKWEGVPYERHAP